MNKGKQKNMGSHRKYLPLSRVAPDEVVFSKYLLERGFVDTHRTFQREILKLADTNGHPANILHQLGEITRMCVADFSDFVSKVKKRWPKGDSNEREGKEGKVLFLLHVWFSMESQRASTS